MSKAWDVVEGLLGVARVVVQAIKNKDQETVDRILDEQMRTTIERALAEAEARAKFGE